MRWQLISLGMSVASAEEKVTIHAAVETGAFFVRSSQAYPSGCSTADLANKNCEWIGLRGFGMLPLFCL
jgi:hypothetical protein